jgi:hypothetical protein
MKHQHSKTFLSLVVASISAVALLTPASPANATGLGGYAGTALSNNYCFYEDYGSVWYDSSMTNCNSAGDQLVWEVALPATPGSTYNPTLEISWPYGDEGYSNISCSVTVCPQNGGSGTCTTSGYVGLISTSGGGTVQPANGTSGLTVPSDGYLFVACEMYSGTGIISINY